MEALEWARARDAPVSVVGLGSNLLVADEGVDGLVLKLAGELASAEVEGEWIHAGGGAPLAVCLHRARAGSLGGLEFACAIPGTVGGGVKMNAGAYDGEIARVLERALIVSAEGAAWRTPGDLGLAYRRSQLRQGEVVARAEFRLTPGRRSPRCRREERRPSRRTSGPSGACSRTRSTS